MNEKAIQDAYEMFKSGGYNGSIDDYKQLISTNGNALNDSYEIFKGGGYNQDINSFKTLMGIGSIKKKSQAENGGSTLGSGLSASQKTDYSKYKKVGDKYYSGNGEFFDNYPGKEGKGYRFNDNQWYEYSSTILGDKEQVEKLDNPIKDPRRVSALNKQFNKTAGTEKGVFIGYPGKEQNEYKINNDGTWQRRTPENKTWVTVTNENSISALNNQFGQSAKKIEPEKISKIKEDNLYQSNFYTNLKSINAQLIGGEEEEAVDVLRRKFPLFTFNEINAGDKIEITSPKGNKEQFTLDNWTWDKDKKISEEMIGWMEGNNLSPSEKKQYANVRRANAEEASFKYPNIGDTAAMKAMQEDMSLNLKKAINPNDVTAPSLELTQYKLEKEKANKKAKELRADWMPIKSQKLNDIVNKYSEYTSYKGNVSEYEKTRAQAALGALASDKVEIGNVNKYQEDIKYNIDSYKSKLNDTSFFNNLQNKYDNGEITEDQYKTDYTNRQKELIDQEKEIQNQIKISDGLIKNVNKSVGENYLIQETKGSIGGGLVLGAIKGVLSPVRLLAGSTGRKMSAAKYHEAVKEAISPLWDFDTSLEYLRSEERSDLTKAAFSVTESLGAMAPMALSGGATLLGTGLLARGAMTATAFYPMSYYEMKDELEEIDIPESDKVAMASIYGVVSSALESIGMEYALGKIDTAIGSSIKRNILKRVLGKSLSKDAPKEAIDALVRNETKLYIASLGLGTLGAMSVEGVTESLQSLTGAGIKEIYDTAKDTEFFSNEGFGDIVKGALYEGYLGALGGGMVHSIYIAKDAYKRNNVLKSKELNNLLMAAKTSGMSEALMSNLKSDMLSNRITKEQAEEISNNFEIVRGMTNQMPENLTVEGQSASLSLMLEKNELNKQIEGKDPNLVKRQAARVNEINERLQEIGEKNTVENAIQEQTAGQVPVQPTTAVGEEVVAPIEAVVAPVEVAEQDTEEKIENDRRAELEGLNYSGYQLINETEGVEEWQREQAKEFNKNPRKGLENIVKLKESLLEEEINKVDSDDVEIRYLIGSINRAKEELILYNEIIAKYDARLSSLNETKTDSENNASQPTAVEQQEAPVVESIAEPQVLTEEGKAEEVAPQTLLEEFQVLAGEKAKAPKAPVVEATPQEKVVTYRAEEQVELLKAIPNIESYKVKGKIDKTKMPKTVLAKYNKIYEKYNALISPLLEQEKTQTQQPAPVVKAPVVKAEAPKTKGELPKMRWDDVEEYDDAVIRSMKEIQYGKLKPLLELGKRTTVAQKTQIEEIKAKILTAERILDKRANKIKNEEKKAEKGEPTDKGLRVRGIDNNGTEAEYSVVVSKDGATAKVQLKKIGTLTPKRASVEANLTIETDEKRGRFVITKNKTKVYIDEAITPAKVETTKAKVTPKAKVEVAPVKEEVKAEPVVEVSKEKQIEKAIAEERLYLESMIEDGVVGFDKDLKLLNSNPYRYADEKNKKFSKKDKNGEFLNPELRNKYVEFYLTIRGRITAPVTEVKKEFIIDGKEYTEEEAIEISKNNFRIPNYGSKMEYNGSNPQAKEFVNDYNRNSSPYNRNGDLKGGYMQGKLLEALGSMNFRKFGNLYRKHINQYFSREANEKSQGGWVSKSYSFRELAGYIIGDASPSYFEEASFRAFAKEAGIEIPLAPVTEVKAEFVKEEAPAPAKKSTDDLMGAINSIKEEIDEINKDIAEAKKTAKDKILPIRNQIEDLDNSNKTKDEKETQKEFLQQDIKDIEDILKKELYGIENETYKGLVGDLNEKIEQLKEEVKKIENLDAKNPENKKTLVSYLDAAIKTLNGLNKLSYAKLDAGISLATLKLILKGIRAGVIAGNTINASIKAMASQYRGKHKNKKITIAEFTKEIKEYLSNTFVDQKTNEQDIQEARDKFVEIREAVRKAKVAVKTESKTLRANAENAIREMLKGKVKNLTAVQMKSIMLRLARFNVFSQTQYDKFIDYVDKVIGIADYDNKVAKANENRKTAKKNLPKLGDISSDLLEPLSRVLSINAKLIPKDVFESYSEIVEMLSKRDAILELNKRADLNESLDKIIESIELNEQRVSDLKDLYDNFAGKTADYAETLDEMLKVGIINQAEHELMKTFKSKIQGAKVKEKMTEQEIADEKAELIDEINNTTITLDEIVGDEFRLERDLVKKLQDLLKNKKTLESLNNKDLKDLLRVIDNINNGFVSNATQEMVEKLNFIEKSILLKLSIPKSFQSIARKINQVLTKIVSEDKFGINVAPLFNIDQQLGDFKTKNIFNSVFNESAKAQQGYQSAITLIQDELDKIERGIATSLKNNTNNIVLSQFKMMVYMMQLEYNSNPNNNQVHQAMKTLDETIKFAKQNSEKSGYNDLDVAQMESIKKEFAKDGEIDIDKLYNSFNESEKNGLKKLQEINNRMTKFATYTATVINGKKIVPFKNYISYTVINESDILSASETTDQINNINANMQPGTVSKNLEERDGKAHPVYLNPFYATKSSSRSVLLNYHMTEAVRTARKTLRNTKTLLQANDDTSNDQYDILNAITNAYNTATRDLLESNFVQSKEWLEFFKRQGYRSMLASGTRAAAELSSNISFVLTNNPFDMKRGYSKEIGKIKGVERKDIMTILKSNVISRLYPQSSINSAFVELTTNSNISTKGRKTKTKIVNGVKQVWDSTAKKYVDVVAGAADFLISKPDQAVMRPLWFGSFSRAFEKETGIKPDFNKIMENNEEYIDKYKDALEKATVVADKQITSAGSSMNSYMGILQNVVRQDDKGIIPAKKEFNRFMNKFTVQEYYTAREGVRALVGNGSMTRVEGAQVLAAVTLRMTIYSVFTRLFAEGVLSVLGYGDDDDDEKTAKQKISQGILSSITTLVFGRYFGNFIRVAENYLIEEANKEYGEAIGLRDGEYDPYEDAIQFNQLQDGKISKTTDLVKVIAGPYSPIIGLGDLGFKLGLSVVNPPKTDRAKLTNKKEMYVRLPLEVGGAFGVVPLYKDIKKVALAEVYKELKKEVKEKAVKKEAKEIKTALTDNRKISSLRKMRSSGRYTDKEINKAIRIIKDPEYKKAFNDKEEAIKKKILDKYGYENLEDFKRNDEDNYEIEFGDDSPYRIKRAESTKITNELEKRVNALEDGEEYYSTDGAAIVVPKKKANKYNRYESVQNNNLPDFYSRNYKKY